MALVFYLIGFIVLIGGLAWAAWLLGVPGTWIAAGAAVLVGIAILSLASSVRQRPRSPPPQPPRH